MSSASRRQFTYGMSRNTHVVRFSLLLRARAFVENTHSCVVIVFVARQIV